jgi:hypothetical protein
MSHLTASALLTLVACPGTRSKTHEESKNKKTMYAKALLIIENVLNDELSGGNVPDSTTIITLKKL